MAARVPQAEILLVAAGPLRSSRKSRREWAVRGEN